ncbi:MAG TPA: DUF4010 domain-containing protein [Terriglobales bacterium]|nr:DUF4010 domain-containing protein [Terriglobales bacterium]
MSESLFRLASALAAGLLIGAERERRKGEGPQRSPAGIRTFALASLTGGVSVVLGGSLLLAVATAAFAVFSAVAYLRTHEQDPGLTSEAALVLTVLLGGLAQTDTATASAMAVIVTVLLAARVRLHRFVSDVISESELADALIFAAATLVVLPLMPNRYLGPFDAINPRTIWKIVILVMSISAGGYIAVRMLGPRFGLPLAGLASGFVSSTATIGAMGTRALQEPALARSAVAGAVLSTVATILQMTAVLAATSRSTLYQMRFPLIASGVAALGYGLFFMFLSVRRETPQSAQKGRAFSLKMAVLFASLIAVVLLLSAALNAWLGKNGVLAAAAFAGLADTHAAAVSVASLVSAGKFTAVESVWPILAAFTTNTISKMAVAVSSGGRHYAMQIIPGLLLVIGAAWAAAFLF